MTSIAAPNIGLKERLLLACTALIVLVVGIVSPYRNWDIIGYVAAAYHADGYRGDDLSRETLSAIRAELGQGAFLALAQGENRAYRETVIGTPRALEQQVPLYSIRVLYVGLMRALHRLGLPYARSTYLISAFFAAASVLLLGMVVVEAGVPVVWVPFIAALCGYTEISRLSTPDALACFLASAAVYATLIENRLAFVAYVALPLARTDFVILSAVLALYAFMRGHKATASVSAIFAFLVFLLTNRLHGNYGWLNLFNFTFVEMSPFPADLEISPRIEDYLRPYIGVALSMALHANRHALIYFLAGYFLIVHWKHLGRFPLLHLLFSVPAAFVVLHLALYPFYVARYFVFATAFILVGLLLALRARDVFPGRMPQR